MDSTFSWSDCLFIASVAGSIGYFLTSKFINKKEVDQVASKKNYVGASVDYNYDRNASVDDSLWWLQTEDGEATFQSSLQAFLNFLSGGWLAPAPCLQIFLFSFGSFGLLISILFRQIFSEAFLYSSISLLLALVFSVLLTKSFGRLLWWKVTWNSRRRRKLIGCRGHAMHRVTLESGMAQIYDQRGTLHRIYCRIEPDGHVIQEGDHLRVVGYDSHENQYLVKRNSL